MTVSSDIYDRGELEDHAVPEAKEVLDDVFQTHYSPTNTPVGHADIEGEEWYFVWDHRDITYRFGVNLWSGNWWLSRKEDGGQYETLLEST